MPSGGFDFREVWADIKSPGDGKQYLVGTITVQDTEDMVLPTMFSGQEISRSGFNPSFVNPFTQVSAPLGLARQIVVLQIVNPALHLTPSEGIVEQRFFYGQGVGTQPTEFGASNARGISVWPAADPNDVRIAICGESYDRDLLFSQSIQGAWNTNAGAALSAGFIAVFNGNAELLWTHQFYSDTPSGQTHPNAHCAITDVSIRVEYNGSQPVRDIVTYCGVSSYGNPFTSAPILAEALSPLAPFVAPGSSCGTSAGGDTDNGVGQWDGIVGRLSRAHGGGGATTREFHSIVGGVHQDGLFGIAEIDESTFVVVGSTGTTNNLQQSPIFPFTDQTCPTLGASSFSVGVLMTFDASNPAALDLVASRRLGSIDSFSVARDVCVAELLPSNFRVSVVGSTTDPDLVSDALAVSGVAWPQPNIGGGADGFLVSGYYAGGVISIESATFRGVVGDQGLTGVQGWNEFADYVAVTGFDSISAADTQIDVASYYVDRSSSLLTSTPLRSLTSASFGGSGRDWPAAQGSERCTAPVISGFPLPAATSLPFEEFGLGDPAGGGVAVNERSQVVVVGATLSTDLAAVNGRSKLGVTEDGVRAFLDLMPAGVARTDGSGVPPSGAPSYPGVYDGGTTPACALAPFGRLIGRPAPELPRMLIDFEGPAPAAGNSSANLVVMQPPVTTIAGGGLWGVSLDWPGYPTAGAPVPIVLPEGLELWTTSAPLTFAAGVVSYQTLRLPLIQAPALLPSGPFALSAQLVCLVTPGVTAGTPGTCGMTSNVVASPCLWFSY